MPKTHAQTPQRDTSRQNSRRNGRALMKEDKERVTLRGGQTAPVWRASTLPGRGVRQPCPLR